MSEIVIGIDLGTTNSCVGVHLNNKLKIIENREGMRLTPSFVFFNEKNGVIVGQYAKRMADSKPEYGIYEIKRLVGRKFDDPHVTKNLKYLPFQVKSISNEPVIIIQNENQIIKKTPQDLCTYILEKIKNDAQAKLGQPIEKAVITVPAYFTIAQREATLAAAEQAGFTVLKLFNEPTAAALSYLHEKKCDDNKESYFVVYDLGGGTFDVAILHRRGMDIDIVSVDGETHLGGHDFDNLLIEHVCKICIKKYNYNPKNDRRNMRRLKNECEEVKKILSVCKETELILSAFFTYINNVEITITRDEFEKMAKPLFQQTIEILDKCLKKANLTKNNIKEVILSGGSTRIPKIQQMIRNYFNGKELSMFLNPDECVAEGAAIQAAMLSNELSQKITQIKITDVIPLSLGISSFVHAMTFLIKRNSPIPTSNTTRRVTVYNNQTKMSFDVYEGERADAKKNNFLGCLEISDLTPAPPGQLTVTVTMSIDQNGILTVSAEETVSGKTKELKIVYTRGKRNDSDIKNIIVDARENIAEDIRFNKFAELKGYLIKYCVRASYNFEEKNLTQTYKQMYDRCSELMTKVKDLEVDHEVEVRKMKDEITTLIAPVEHKYKFKNMP